MDIRQMRYFVAVAEERSFSRAADRLHISQPPLSQQIKNLEEELDAQLFHRLPRGVALTAAGTAFLKSCRSILAQIRQAAQETTQIAAGMMGTLRVGTVSSALVHALPRIIQNVSESMPGTKIELMELSSHEQTQALLRDELDVGVLHTPVETTGLLTYVVLKEPFSAVVPGQHRLALNSSVRVEELAREEFVFFPRSLASGLFDKVVSLCMEAGFSPHIAHTARHQSSILQMVTLGLGITIVPQSLKRIYNGNAVFLPLEDAAQHLELSLAWKAHENSLLVERLVASLRSATA